MGVPLESAAAELTSRFRYFTLLYVLASRVRPPFRSLASGKISMPPTHTPCGGRRRAHLRAFAGSDSVRPADCLVGGGAAYSRPCRGTVAHDPRSAVHDRDAVDSNRTDQTRNASRRRRGTDHVPAGDRGKSETDIRPGSP